MSLFWIIFIVLYSVGFLFTAGVLYSSWKIGATKEDSKVMVVFIGLLLWILSPVLMLDSVIRGLCKLISRD